MNRIKRQRIDDRTTKFEHLSNDIVYELFEYLDQYNIYESFYHLNTRFQDLICASILPFHIGHVPISKPTFDRFYDDIILKNMHSISSFVFAEPLNIFYVPLLLQNTLKFVQLKCITFFFIDLNYVKNTLDCLVFSPTLCSLTIQSTNVQCITNTTEFYQSIFQLSRLKYCKLSFANGVFRDLLRISSDEEPSSIEHFVFNCHCTWQFLAALLSYVPRLHRLFIRGLHGDAHNQVEQFVNVPNELIRVSLCMFSIEFDQFSELSKILFSNLQVLHLFVYNRQYINAIKWEQLISSSMPYLRVFDVKFADSTLFKDQNDDSISCQNIMRDFKSSFWTERQWFFTHRHHCEKKPNEIFYSTEPFRKSTYILDGIYDDSNKCLFEKESNYTYVHRLILESKQAIESCSIYFPNVFVLEISVNCPVNLIARLVPLSQIHTISIMCNDYELKQLFELFAYTSNCHTLTIKSLRHENTSILPFQNNINTQQLKNLIIQDASCTIECLTLLVEHFNSLKRIINDSKQNMSPAIVHYLLTKARKNVRCLCSLQLASFNGNEVQDLRTFIKTNKLLNNYIIKHVGRFCYISW